MKDAEGIIQNLLENIQELEKLLEDIKRPANETSKLIPQTTQNINDVITYLEDTSHSIMNLLEEVKTRSVEINEDTEFLMKLDPIGNIKTKLERIHENNKKNIETLLQLFTYMSFHDLAGQQLKAAIELLEKMRNTLVDALVSQIAAEKNIREENIQSLKGKVSQLITKDRISQDDVDKLIEELGY